MATASLLLNAGDVRLLIIHWPLEKDDAFSLASPQNTYDDVVVDANGVETGKISNQLISYKHVTDPDCGVDVWTGAASD
jgi:hypothetical protein